MVGTTLKRAGQAGLAAMTLADKEEIRALHAHCDWAEGVYLATCNRVQAMFVGRPGISTAAYRRRLQTFFTERAHRRPGAARSAPPTALTAYAGEGAVEQLFVVAAALDSLVPGEAQILGQVKAAFAEAKASQFAGEQLERVFMDAFAIAKEVRERTALGRGRTSMFSLATSAIESHVSSLPAQGPLRLVVVGTGGMAEQCAAWAQGRGNMAITFVNRTGTRAEALAARFGGKAQSLAAFCAAPMPCDVLVTSTASEQPILPSSTLARLGTRALLVDLAVPRDIEPAAAAHARLPLLDVDRLQAQAAHHVAARQAQVGEARTLIDAALERFRARQLGRSVGATLEAWRADGRRLLERELASARRSTGSVAEGAARAPLEQTLESFGRRLLGHWLHGPTLGLKAIGQRFGAEAVEAFAREALRPGRHGAAADAKPPTVSGGRDPW